jgi:hypothetical protein
VFKKYGWYLLLLLWVLVAALYFTKRAFWQ